MSVYFVNIDVRGDGGSPTLTASRMGVYFTDKGMTPSILSSVYGYRRRDESFESRPACDEWGVRAEVHVASMTSYSCYLGNASKQSDPSVELVCRCCSKWAPHVHLCMCTSAVTRIPCDKNKRAPCHSGGAHASWTSWRGVSRCILY